MIIIKRTTKGEVFCVPWISLRRGVDELGVPFTAYPENQHPPTINQGRVNQNTTDPTSHSFYYTSICFNQHCGEKNSQISVVKFQVQDFVDYNDNLFSMTMTY